MTKKTKSLAPAIKAKGAVPLVPPPPRPIPRVTVVSRLKAVRGGLKELASECDVLGSTPADLIEREGEDLGNRASDLADELKSILDDLVEES